MASDHSEADVVVVGGGPAGAAASSLLASFGHRVQLLTQPYARLPLLANSLPPSTRKLLDTTNFLDLVDAVAYRSYGNTVWWGDREGVAEPFDSSRQVFGHQVLRSALDPLLVARAAHAGAQVRSDGTVARVELGTSEARVVYRTRTTTSTTIARMVLDCSGRSGIVARQGLRRAPDHQMQALLGVWERPRWRHVDDTHTIVETNEHGWSWLIPVSSTVGHVGTMVDGATTPLTRRGTLEATYRAELARSRQLSALLATARLQHVWACDASMYGACAYAGPPFMLVGDAATAIDPLSSFGMKKALGSAWLAAIAANTCLRHPERRDAALQYFTQAESDMHARHAVHSREFAREACARHPSPFWRSRAEASGPAVARPPVDERQLLGQPRVVDAFEALRRRQSLDLARNPAVSLVRAPLVRDREIVLADAVAMPEAAPLHFVQGVDLVMLSTLAPRFVRVPDLFEAYSTQHASVSLPALMGALSVLIAANVLHVTPTH